MRPCADPSRCASRADYCSLPETFPAWQQPDHYQSRRMITAEDIIARAAWQYNLRAADIRAPRRMARYVKARRLAMALCRHLLGWSYEDLGQVVRRDHSNIIHACRKMARLLQ